MANIIPPKIIPNPKQSNSERYDEDLGLITEIFSDFKAVGEGNISVENIQFYRRSWVRTFFSLVDAYAFILKNRVKPSVDKGAIKVTKRERECLFEKKTNGKGETSRFHPEFLSNLRIAIRLYARSRSTEEKVPDKLDNFPSELSIALGIRHRITHPKNLDSYSITNEEFSHITQALNQWVKELFDWRYSAEMDYIHKIKITLNESSNELREMIADDLKNKRP